MIFCRDSWDARRRLKKRPVGSTIITHSVAGNNVLGRVSSFLESYAVSTQADRKNGSWTLETISKRRKNLASGLLHPTTGGRGRVLRLFVRLRMDGLPPLLRNGKPCKSSAEGTSATLAPFQLARPPNQNLGVNTALKTPSQSPHPRRHLLTSGSKKKTTHPNAAILELTKNLVKPRKV